MHVSELRVLAYWMCKKNLYLLKRKETHFVVQNAFLTTFVVSLHDVQCASITKLA